MPLSHTNLVLWVLFCIILKLGCMLIQDKSTYHLMPFPPAFCQDLFVLLIEMGGS